MGDQVKGCTPVIYVADVPAAVLFYGILGFVEQATGDDGEWRYAYLRCGELGLLLAAGGSPRGVEPGPVVLYLQVRDIAVVESALRDAGAQVQHLGYPDHAPGGEVKALDPDGHGLMLGQVAGTAPPGSAQRDDPENRSNVLRRAATAARRRGLVPQRCQIPATAGLPCEAEADVKLTDSWGDSAWACLRHADEVMINAPAAFLATEDSQGIAGYVRRRQRRPPPQNG